MQANLITTSTGKPAQYAPRFCLKLKYNCKLRSTHPCCKFPLPPRDDHQTSTTAVPNKGKLNVKRPTRIPIGPSSTTQGTKNFRKSQFKRRKQIKNKIDIENVSTDNNVEPNTKRKKTLRSKEQKPAFNSGRKSPVNNQRRRPEHSLSVCRIINCKRNKNHKCCQEQEQIFSTQKTTATQHYESTIQETTEPIQNYLENSQKEEYSEYLAFVSQKESISSTETRYIQATSPRRRKNDTDNTVTENVEVN